MSFLKELNPSQLEAVTYLDGPLLVLAGAGSGKTKVLATRIANLVENHGVPASGILAVTFTNKAAGEMRERLGALLGNKASDMWLGTFHSLGLRILRRDGHLLGLTRDMTIYDDSDQLRLIKLIMEELKISEKAISPKAILYRINQAKNEVLTPEEYQLQSSDFFAERVARVFTLYQKKLEQMSAVDFGDLIVAPTRLFQRYPKILEQYQNRFRHILVDEYQDTNKAQYVLMNSLAAGHENLCAVGDPDQSIYAWRGADIRNIMEFEEDWPDATVFKLEQNYRSTGNILNAANSVIARNAKRYEKNLWTDNPEGTLVRCEQLESEHKEAKTVIKLMHETIGREQDYTFGDFAVFYRTNAQSRVFEEQFIREGLPYAIIGGVRFYERREIKDALCYLKIVANPKDALSFKRIINTPARGVGSVTLANLDNLAIEHGITFYEAFGEAIKMGKLKKPEQLKLFNALQAAREQLGNTPLHEVALTLLEDAGYIGMWEKEAQKSSGGDSDGAYGRIENLHELISAMKDFEEEFMDENVALSDFLDRAALISDVDSYEGQANRITLMTLHSAKGLEFPVVFMCGLEEGLFPHSRSLDSEDELEEERRLCYVGMTRAKEKLFMLSARTRTVFGVEKYQTSSRFIDEVADEFIEREDSGVGGGYGSGYASGFKRTGAGASARNSAKHSNEPYYVFDESQEQTYTDDYADQSYQDPSSGGGSTTGSQTVAPFAIGSYVSHPKFGRGIIKAREGSGEKSKLTIHFQSVGPKKLVLKYAPLTPA